VVFTRKQTLGGYRYFLWTLVNPVKHHGACATVAYLDLIGKVNAKDKDILVSLRGGKLLIGNTAPTDFKAWFLHENRLLADTDIFFGHWSTLSNTTQPHVYPMDKGCAWGG
jgi:diadenosine tetraphosphatase ApaH/serine/threonine PP2A family protein phosphatase